MKFTKSPFKAPHIGTFVSSDLTSNEIIVKLVQSKFLNYFRKGDGILYNIILADKRRENIVVKYFAKQ